MVAVPQIVDIRPFGVGVCHTAHSSLSQVFPVPHPPCHNDKASRIKGTVAGGERQQRIPILHIDTGQAERTTLHLVDIIIKFRFIRKIDLVPIIETGIRIIRGIGDKIAEDLILIRFLVGIQLDDRMLLVVILIDLIRLQRAEHGVIPHVVPIHDQIVGIRL